MIPINTLLFVFIFLYLLKFFFELYINKLNALNNIKYGKEIPEPFHGIIDEDKLFKMQRYNLDQANFSKIQLIISKTFFLIIILSGILPYFAKSIHDFGFITGGLIFFACPALLFTIIDLPFDYYHSFVIEEKYGFNTKTIKLWILDLIKGLIIACIIGGFLMSSLLIIIKYYEQSWWLFAWLVITIFQLFIIFIYPTVIAPIFNKFTPIENIDLKTKIEELAEKSGINISGIFQMDASKRTRHTNAYVSGFGKSKRIVLFDSLINSHTDDEILAVLAHEVGHSKKNHIRKHLFMNIIMTLVLFYFASQLMQLDIIYSSFGFLEKNLYIGLFLVSIIWEPAGFFLTPIMMAISRHFEKQADSYAVKTLKTSIPLQMALKKMANDNLSNLRPHPLFVWFNYSHPPLLERIEYLENLNKKILLS